MVVLAPAVHEPRGQVCGQLFVLFCVEETTHRSIKQHASIRSAHYLQANERCRLFISKVSTNFKRKEVVVHRIRLRYEFELKFGMLFRFPGRVLLPFIVHHAMF